MASNGLTIPKMNQATKTFKVPSQKMTMPKLKFPKLSSLPINTGMGSTKMPGMLGSKSPMGGTGMLKMPKAPSLGGSKNGALSSILGQLTRKKVGVQRAVRIPMFGAANRPPKIMGAPKGGGF